MRELTLLSLFDGSGGFPLAASMCGIRPVAAAEVEPYPIAVTSSRFPDMKHLGDVSKVNGAEIEPVDVITFGSPCQDLSVAGKRSGLKHEANGDGETTRSGLFMEAVRIIKEMREATNGEYPTFALWENVPGAFSSNKGEDFRTVCEELIKIVEPTAIMPAVPKNGWPYADSYIGDGWSLAYRVFDAQYWGVPQRRRRIYLVLDLRGERAREVLFKREGLRWDFAQSRTPCQGLASDAQNCARADDREAPIAVATQQGGAEISENGICPTITAAAGMSGNNQPWICKPVAFIQNQRDEIRDLGDKAGCLQAEPGMKQQTFIIDSQYLFQPMSIREENWAAGQVKNAVRAGERKVSHVVVQKLDNQPFVAHTAAYAMQGFGDYKESNTASGLKARDYKDATDLVVGADGDGAMIRYIVRRLTPTECARLQGFPDKWGHPDPKEDFTEEEYRFWLDVRNTHAAINGKTVKDYTKRQTLAWYNKLHTDSAEYKMWGNGIALPTALYVMQGIKGAGRLRT